MPHLTIELEQSLRAEIVAAIVSIGDLAGNVFDRRRKFTSRKDFLDRVGQTIGTGSNKVREIRFTELELLNFEDAAGEGFDDCPVPVLTYGLHIFHEFSDNRADGSNSDKDFTNYLFLLRSKMLNTRYFQSRKAVADWSVMPEDATEFTQFGGDTFTDVVGHYKDLVLKILYYDEAQ